MRKQVLVALAAVLAAALPVGVGAQSSTMSGLAACTGNELTAADLLLVDDEATTSCKLTGAELAASALMDIWVDETGDSVAFLNITNTTGNSLAVDTDTFVCNATTNRCGIGTTSPSYPLHLFSATSPVRLAVETTAVNGGAQVSMKNDAQEWLLNTAGLDSDRFGIYDVTGGSLRVFGISPGAPASSLMIDSSGRVGINDATPGYKLAVVGTSGSGYVGVTSVSDGDIFEIDAAGDVGIGTNAPAQRLHVKEGSAGTITYTNLGAIVESNSSTTLHIASPDASTANIAFANDSNDISCEFSNNPALSKFRIVCVETDMDIWLEPDRDLYMELDVPGTNKVCIQTVGIGTICDYGLLVTAPTTCTVGDTYTDTSPAKCWCSATNTWSVVVGSTCT